MRDFMDGFKSGLCVGGFVLLVVGVPVLIVAGLLTVLR